MSDSSAAMTQEQLDRQIQLILNGLQDMFANTPNPAVSREQINQQLQRLLNVLQENLTRADQVHREFLHNQTQAIQVLASAYNLPSLVAEKIQPLREYISKSVAKPVISSLISPLISKRQLQEFGTGLIAACFGPEFAVLDQRRTPRIPNGDLLMMDRVLDISGRRGDLNPPASVVTEYDVDPQAWFLAENTYPGLPMAVLMEIALQPCGILSAWLGTSLSLPAEVNTFRNLDGTLTFSAMPQLVGAVIRNQARLLSSVSSSGMLIQKYAFELFADGQPFLSGESSFGYFKEAVMLNQTGLEKKANAAPHILSQYPGQIMLEPPLKAGSFPLRHLALVDKIIFVPDSGRFNAGLIAGEQTLDGKEWFYRNHFYQDPVMPGSLGVEAIMQGIWAAMQQQGLTSRFKQPMLDFSHTQALTWKYRGQVIPPNQKVYFDIHLKEKKVDSSEVHWLADADFWVDNLKIYAIQDISIKLKEGQTL